MGAFTLGLCVMVTLAGIAAMQWGSSRVCNALDAYRGRLGIGGVVAGAMLGIATASPEVSVNIASATFGWPDLGLGTALGSNVPALPLIFVVSWFSLRYAKAKGPTDEEGMPPTAATQDPSTPVVAPAAVPVQVWPYLAVVLLLGILTLPPRWEGLQPIDGVILLGAWGLYMFRALSRPRQDAKSGIQASFPYGSLLLGVPAIALGALASVMAAQRLGQALGLSDLVVGLFVIGLLCALPESFTAWGLARQGKTTTAVSTGMGDGIVSLTAALLPPCLLGAAVGDRGLYMANLTFLIVVLATYIALNHFRRGQELGAGKVAIFAGGYVVYLAIVIYLLAV
jgi:cation:H+ antiporter